MTVHWPIRAGRPQPEHMAGGAVGTARRADGQVVLGLWDRLAGREAERFGMGPAVVPGQDLTEAARPVGKGLTADLAARHRKVGHGHREAAGT